MRHSSRILPLIVITVIVVVCLPLLAAKKSDYAISSYAKYVQIEGATPMGADACTTCHGDIAKDYRHAFHAQQGVECEQCHGPGSLHVQGGGAGSCAGASEASSSATPAPISSSPIARSVAPAEIDEVATVKAKRAAVEQEETKLRQQIAQLEADRSARKYLPDLAMVKGAQAPVFAQDNALSKVLFRADPEDEFEVSDAHAGWVHIRLENGAQGWIMMNELQLPNQSDDTGDSADFTEPNEEVAPFTGDWAVLKNKPTLFVVAQQRHAIPPTSLGQSQMDFAKRAFLDGYRAAAHSQEKIDGVAVVFLGDKAGMVAATLPEITQWHKGAISDKLFLERCFLSPPEAFRDTSKQ